MVQTLPNIEKSESDPLLLTIINDRYIETNSIILYCDPNIVAIPFHRNLEMSGTSMLDDIHQQFSHSLKEQGTNIILKGFRLPVILAHYMDTMLFLDLVGQPFHGRFKTQFI
jgi:hypothetical protein